MNKLAYGLRVPLTHTWLTRWNEPLAGEIVVFASPKDGTRLVKRIIAGPGDTVELRNNVVLINSVAQVYSPLAESTLETVPCGSGPGVCSRWSNSRGVRTRLSPSRRYPCRAAHSVP